MTLLSSKATQYIWNFTGAENIARSVFFWIVVAFVIASAICFIVLKDEKQRKKAKIAAFSIGTAICVSVIATFLAFYGKEAKELDLLPLLYAPLIIFCVCLVASVIALLVRPTKIIKIVSAVVLTLSFISVVVCLSIYYQSGTSLKMNWIEAENVNTIGLWIGAVLLAVGIILTAVFTDKTKGLDFDVKSLTYAGVLGGLSLALSYVRIVKMPMGGSITLASVLPIMLYAYIFGTKKGVILGVIMGILQAIQDPWILHPAQFLLDYPLAFSAFGLTGCFAKTKIKSHSVKFLLGGILAGVVRFVSHFFAGAFAFGSFAPEGFSSIYVYSLAYNSAYVFPDTAIAVVIGTLLFLSKSFTKVALLSGAKKKTATDETSETVETETTTIGAPESIMISETPENKGIDATERVDVTDTLGTDSVTLKGE